MSYFNKKNIIDQWGPIDARVLYPSFWYKATGMIVHGIEWPLCVGEFYNDRMTFYWEREIMEIHSRQAIEKWILPKKKRNQLWKEYQDIVKKLKINIKDLKKFDITTKTEINKLTNLWYHNIVNFWRNTLVSETANYGAPIYLKQLLLKDGILPANCQEIIDCLLTPNKLSFHQQNELELLRIFFKKTNLQNKALARMEKKWHWIDNSYFETRYIDKKEWRKRLDNYKINDIKKIYKRLKEYSDFVNRKKNNIIKKYNLPPRYLEISNALSLSLWWQDNRKGISWQTFSAIQKILISLQKHYQISSNDLLYYTAEDWFRLGVEGKKLSKEQLNNRKGYFIFVISEGKYQLFFKNQAKDKINSILKQKQKQHSQSLKGIVAYYKQRYVTGKVHIVISPRNIESLKNNEILVTPMTSPDYIHLMRQAKAIVADVGGLMSHAAIISREMRKPCLIGTNIATKKLKNNDIIKIDFKSGEIKIIKHRKL